MLPTLSHFVALRMFGNSFQDYLLPHLLRDEGDVDWPVVLFSY